MLILLSYHSQRNYSRLTESLQFGAVFFPRGGTRIAGAILSTQEPAVRVVVTLDVASVRIDAVDAELVVELSVRVVADPDLTRQER